MKRKQIEIKSHIPYRREAAAEVAACASRFDCSVKLEDKSACINLKSVIGLLSMAITGKNPTELVCDGPDEEAALAAVEAVLLG